MPKKMCVAYGGLNKNQKKELESRIKKTVDEYDAELKEDSSDDDQTEPIEDES